MDDLRDSVYWWSLNLVKRGFKLEGIFLLLSTWNFATFRYAMIRFKIKKFKEALNKCGFDFFKGKKFETTDLSDEEIGNKIKRIYTSLSQFDGVKYVGATKVMHLMSPEFFLMWDTKIIKKYKKHTPRGFINKTAQGYLNFMKEIQRRYKENKFNNLPENVTIPRAIDLYNMKFSRR